jgi:predicted ATP-grasp superfamily ATP-dependent carboligase
LYDARFATGLVKVHVDACAGTLPDRPPACATTPIRGERIVFTTHATRVDREHVERLLAFGCHDVPQPDSHIAPDAPLCSVSAHGDSTDAVRVALAQQEAAVLAMVQNRNEAHHHAS